MKRKESDVVSGDPPCQGFRSILGRRWFSGPDLQLWSIDRAGNEEPGLMGAGRHDYERELRIKALGFLSEAPCATPLWRRVCSHRMLVEIRARSSGQRLAMELALLEQIRGQR
jgi:hypothetical protein